MLQIVVPAQELFNEVTYEITYTKEHTLNLEHSLLSISKWEAKWKKPFIDSEKTTEEKRDYIRCMSLDRNVPKEVFDSLTAQNYKDIDAYIDDSMTATWFRERKGRGNKEVITNEVIYYWMVANQIPFECEKWHLNRLLTLIRVCSEKNQPEKKMGKNELMQRNRALNAARRKKLHTSG